MHRANSNFCLLPFWVRLNKTLQILQQNIRSNVCDCSKRWLVFWFHTPTAGSQLRLLGFVVALIALCKSGKSTFLNALMGCDYLPSHNLPETARIVRVKHTVGDGQGFLTDGVGNEVVGHESIREKLKSLNHQARESGSMFATMNALSLLRLYFVVLQMVQVVPKK